MYRIKGSISVFISLIMIVVLSLCCSVCEAVRYNSAFIQEVLASDAATESVMAGYDRSFYDTFNILGSYITEIEACQEKMTKDIQKIVRPKKDFPVAGIGISDMRQIDIIDINISEYELISDFDGHPFFEQAVSYMRDNIWSGAIELVKNYAEKNEDPSYLEEYYSNEEKNTEKEIEESINQTQEDKDTPNYDNESNNDAESIENKQSANISEEPIELKETPMEIIKKLKEKGILYFVEDQDKVLSESTVEAEQMTSGRNLKKGYCKDVENHSISTIDKVLFTEYLSDKLSSYVKTINSSSLSYQMEYVIGGEESDISNLKKVVGRLLALKEASNFAFLISDSDSCARAEAVAVAIASALGVPLAATPIRYALLLAWAYGESILDVRNLLCGGSSALLKTKENWKLSIENMSELSDRNNKPVKENNGLTYETYLKMLIMFVPDSDIKMRALDMAEEIMKKKYENDAYRIDNLLIYIKSECRFSSRAMFMSFNFMKKYIYDNQTIITSECSVM